MDNFVDFYSILQVHPDAEPEIIQTAYKRLSRKYHPDVNPGPGATEQMSRINLAYETLGDERARRLYHTEWQRRSKTGVSSGATRVEVRERVVYVTKEPPPPAGTKAAYEAVKKYFESISKLDFKSAFACISLVDREHFTYDEFMEWQASVAELYELGSFDLKLFKSVPHFKVGGKAFTAEEYTVTLREKEIVTGQVTQYAVTKRAVCENGVWHVYLGYENLTPLLVQFKSQASSNMEARFVGLWEKYCGEHDPVIGILNRKGFEDALAPEVYRQKRYNRPFSLAVFEINVPEKISGGGHYERILKYVSCIMGRTIRCIDKLGYLENGRFAVLFAETDKSVAGQAARRVLRTVRRDVAACFDFEIEVRAGLVEYNGQELDVLIDGCLRTIVAASKTVRKPV